MSYSEEHGISRATNRLSGSRYSQILVEWVRETIAHETGELRVSLDDIARFIGVSRPMVSQVRQGRKTFGNLVFKNLAEKRQVSFLDFLAQLAKWERRFHVSREESQGYFGWHTKGLPDVRYWLTETLVLCRRILAGPRLTSTEPSREHGTAPEKAIVTLLRSICDCASRISDGSAVVASLLFLGVIGKRTRQSNSLTLTYRQGAETRSIESSESIARLLATYVTNAWSEQRTDDVTCGDSATWSPLAFRLGADRSEFWAGLGASKDLTLPSDVLLSPVSYRTFHRSQAPSTHVKVTLILGVDIAPLSVLCDEVVSDDQRATHVRDLEQRRSFLLDLSSMGTVIADYVCKGILSDLAAQSGSNQFDFNHSMNSVLSSKPSLHAERFELLVKQRLTELEHGLLQTPLKKSLLAVDAWFIEAGEAAFHNPGGFDQMTFVTELGEQCAVTDPESGQECSFASYYRRNLDALCPRVPQGKSFGAIDEWQPVWFKGASGPPLTPRAVALNLGDAVGLPFQFEKAGWQQRGILWFRFRGSVRKKIVYDHLRRVLANRNNQSAYQQGIDFNVCVPSEPPHVPKEEAL